jgi:hypothetical protein
MNHGIRRTANRRVDTDRIDDRFASQNPAEPEIFFRHLDNADAGQLRQHITTRIHCWNCRVVR